jgi:phosphatidylserine decarboxylase
VFQHRVHGRFLSLRTPESLVQNERLVHVIDADGMHIGVVQIASRLVRRIVAYLREGDRVEKGQRIGMIRFGSQVDLILPGRYGFQLCVQPGQAVFAGETVIARIPVCREEC